MKDKKDSFDQEVTRLVRAVEQDVPERLNHAFLEALHAAEPLRPHKSEEATGLVWHRQGRLLTAAAILLVMVLLSVFVLQHQPTPSSKPAPPSEEVQVLDSQIEGQPADTFVVNPQDTNMTVIWIEKMRE